MTMTVQQIEQMRARRVHLWKQVECAEIHADTTHLKKCMREIAQIDRELSNSFED